MNILYRFYTILQYITLYNMNSQNIEGYGWGVWLLVEDEELNSIMYHPTHITIMCNMVKDDAVKLYKDLSELCRINHIALCNNICQKFEGTSYTEDEPFKFASGYYCEVEMWNIIRHYCKNLLKYDKKLGSFSEKPHITYCYSNNEHNIRYYNLEKRKLLKCKLVIADIRNANPHKWYFLK